MANFFQTKEKEDIKKLNDFNRVVRLFKEIKPTDEFTQIDAVATDFYDNKVSIELKSRNISVDDYDTILIEPSKMAYFTKIMESGYTQNEKVLYINFCNDGVLYFDFSKIGEDDVKFYPNHRQYNYGKKRYEYETRFGLKTKAAWKLKYTDEGIEEDEREDGTFFTYQ